MVDTELNKRMQRMAGLVGELESLGDPKVRRCTKELVQLIMEMHGAALERILETLFANGEIGQRTIDQLGSDPLVSSLLVLYGLHPEELESRVSTALRRVGSNLRSHGVEVELSGIENGRVRIRARVASTSCSSTAATARTLLENAIYEAAPDATSVVIEGLDGKQASGFVPLTNLLGEPQTGHPSTVGNGASSSMQPVTGD